MMAEHQNPEPVPTSTMECEGDANAGSGRTLVDQLARIELFSTLNEAELGNLAAPRNTSRSSVVRWCSAKAIDRITS